MGQERRVILAALLSSFIMVWYLQAFGKTMPRQLPVAPAQQSQPAQAEQQELQLLQGEEIVSIESDHLRLEVGKISASVRRAILKEFRDLSTNQQLEFGLTYPMMMVQVGEHSNRWNFQFSSPREAGWTYEENGLSQRLSISLDASTPTFSVEASVKNNTGSEQNIPISIVASFSRGDNLNGRSNPLELVLLTAKATPWQRAYLRYFGSRSAIIVPRGTRMVTLSERYFCHSIKPSNGPVDVSVLPSSQVSLSARLNSSLTVKAGEKETFLASSYVGPRDFFKLRDAGFEAALHIGFFGKIGLGLMLLLNWIASMTHSYGAAVVILAVLVTLGMAPFTMISFRSMKKMRELQPKIDQLKKKHSADPKRLNQETFSLFKEHRVSPMSGCLPMLIQIPVFFSIWSAISHVIEIRGESFLWIKDLSLPDRLARIPPGLDLNILPILMAVAMFIQTKLSQPQVPQGGTNEMAKMMSGPLMPVMFGLMFYNLPSCLVLYWLTNSLTTLAFYKFAKP